jgi:hypothetical protein
LKPATIALALLLGTAFSVLAAEAASNMFPAGALDQNSARSDSFRNDWYSRHLRAMSEPVLRPIKGTRSYRFTWLRTFHHPVAVRIVETGGRAELFATELDGAGGYDPGQVLRTKRLTITTDQFEQIENLIRRNGFWSLPSRDDALGFDGSEWIVEGATDEYRVVCRWSPKSGPIRAIGEEFLSLTGWHYKPEESY